MYETNPEFEPTRDDTVLWRYMDTPKFLALLQQSALHFARSDLLDDRFEGSYGALSPSQIMEIFGGEPPELVRTLAGGNFENFRKLIYMNCWHQGEHESEAMWRRYASKNAGIAIRTTFKALKESISDHRTVHMGKVEYMDYKKMFVKAPYDFIPFLRKRKGFEFEREVRVVCLQELKGRQDNANAWEQQPPGINLEIELTDLIEGVVVAPLAQDWMIEVVQEVADRYGLTAPIHKSELAGEPDW